MPGESLFHSRSPFLLDEVDDLPGFATSTKESPEIGLSFPRKTVVLEQ